MTAHLIIAACIVLAFVVPSAALLVLGKITGLDKWGRK